MSLGDLAKCSVSQFGCVFSSYIAHQTVTTDWIATFGDGNGNDESSSSRPHGGASLFSLAQQARKQTCHIDELYGGVPSFAF